MTYTKKMHEALRRDTAGKHNQVTDLLDEIERLQGEVVPVSSYEEVCSAFDRKQFELSEAMKIIEPFAREGEGWAGNTNMADPDDIPFIRHKNDTQESSCAFCVRDLRNAFKWLKTLKET